MNIVSEYLGHFPPYVGSPQICVKGDVFNVGGRSDAVNMFIVEAQSPANEVNFVAEKSLCPNGPTTILEPCYE